MEMFFKLTVVPRSAVLVGAERHFKVTSIRRDGALNDSGHAVIPGRFLLEQAMRMKGSSFVGQIVLHSELDPIAPWIILAGTGHSVDASLTSWLPQADPGTVH